MLHRGLRRRFDAAVEQEAREARPFRGDVADRRDLRDLATFTIDPATARDFDDAISAEERDGGRAGACGCTSPTSPRTCGRARAWTARPTAARRASTSPARSSRCCPRRSRTGACSLVPGEDRLAVTVELELPRRAGRARRFYRSLIRSDERLDYERVDRIFAGRRAAPREPWARAAAASRAAWPRAMQAEREARGALVVDSSEPEFTFDDAGQRRRRAPRRADRVAPPDRAPDDRRQRGRRRPVGRPRHPHAVPRPRPPRPRARSRRLVDQLASLDVPTPPVPEHLSPHEADDARGRDLAPGRPARAARGGRGRRRSPRSCCARSSRPRYSPPQPRPRRAALAALLPLHLADPPLPGPRLPPGAAVGGRGGRGGAAGRRAGRGWATWTSAARARGDGGRARRRRRRALLPARARAVGATATGVRRRGGRADRRGRVRATSADGYEGLLPVRRLRGDWWELNEQGTMLAGAESRRVRSRLGRRGARRGRPDRRAARGRVDLLPGRAG